MVKGMWAPLKNRFSLQAFRKISVDFHNAISRYAMRPADLATGQIKRSSALANLLSLECIRQFPDQGSTTSKSGLATIGSAILEQGNESHSPPSLLQ